MKNLLIIALILSWSFVQAQPNQGGGGAGAPAPFGLIELLVLGGAALGGKHLYNLKRSMKDME